MPGEIRHIFILTETPFRLQDYKRFGVETLSKHFTVQVLDCTRMLRPAFWEQHAHITHVCPEYRSIGKLEEIEEISALYCEETIAIDYLFSGPLHHQIRKTLRRHKILRAVVLTGLLPSPKRQNWTGIPRETMRLLRDRVQCVYRDIRCKLYPVLDLPAEIADIALLSGKRSIELPKAHTPFPIWGHSFDYETFTGMRNASEQHNTPYALFIDQNLVSNTDRLISGSSQLVTAPNYYPALNRFFSDFESRTGLPVVIAAHPRARYEGISPFMGRSVVSGQTASLTQGASLVFAHYSTGISLPVLWRKPIVFLTSTELRACWLQSYIEAFREALAAPLLDIDNYRSEDIQIERWLQISQPAYAAFRERHVKIPGSSELPLWELFSRAVRLPSS